MMDYIIHTMVTPHKQGNKDRRECIRPDIRADTSNRL